MTLHVAPKRVGVPEQTGSHPRPQQLIMTIFGLYARGEGGALPVAALIRMLQDLGVEEAGVRSSVSRMKRRGTLQSYREAGVVKYALPAESLEILIEGDSRIYSRRRARATDPWMLLVFSIPEAQRGKRHALRSQLTRMGFGSVAPGVWVAPISLRSETEAWLRRAGVGRYVALFSVDPLTFGQLDDSIGRWWDLDSLDSLYRDFIERYEPISEDWRRSRELAENDKSEELLSRAFSDYIYMFTAWRRMPFLDPGLPLEFLPENWSGVAAEQLFFGLHDILGQLANEHMQEIIHPQ